jgi:hypothetical protein
MTNDDAWVWELRHEETLLGVLTEVERDMFWASCDFAATPDFEPYRALFDTFNAVEPGSEEWGRAYEAIHQQNLILIRKDDELRVREFILYIDGSTAGLRPVL